MVLLTEDEDDSSGIDKPDAGSFVKKYAVLFSRGKPYEINPRIHVLLFGVVMVATMHLKQSCYSLRMKMKAQALKG
jgi:hypothetical protein